MTEYRIIYTTVPDITEAKKIAKILVEEKYAACVNLFPIKSTYIWEGKLQEDEEVAMFIKTKAALANKIISKIKELHTYELPCIISLPIEEGYKEFLNWIDKSTSS